jgi:hypothetical protein
MPREIPEWVSRQHLPMLHSITEVASVPSEHATLFHVVYGRCSDVCPKLPGLLYRNRIGWMIPRQPPTADSLARSLKPFVLRSGDRYLLSAAWDSVVARAAWVWPEWWRNVLLASSATPLPRLAEMLAQDHSDADLVIRNPGLESSRASKADLLTLAAVNPAVAVRIMDLPRIAHDQRALRWIADRYQDRDDVLALFRDHLRVRTRELVTDPRTPEPVLLDLLLDGYVRGDTLLSRMLDNPTAFRSQRIITLLAINSYVVPPGVRVRARALLAKRNLTVDAALHALLWSDGSDSLPCANVVGILDTYWYGQHAYGQRAMQVDADYATRPGERCGEVRELLGQRAAQSSYTALVVLRSLAAWLTDHPDARIDTALSKNPLVRTDSVALALLAHSAVPAVSRQADSLLRYTAYWTELAMGDTAVWDTAAWSQGQSDSSVFLEPLPNYITNNIITLRRLGQLAVPDTLRAVVTDSSAWTHLWSRLIGPDSADRAAIPASAIDFSQYVVLAGSTGTPMESLLFRRASQRQDTVYVDVLSVRSRVALCGTHVPYNQVALELIPRPTGPVVFLEGVLSPPCKPRNSR